MVLITRRKSWQLLRLEFDFRRSMVADTRLWNRTAFEDSLGFSPALARLLTACYGTLYLAAGILALFVVDRFGRRKMVIFGAAGMETSALIIVSLSISPSSLTHSSSMPLSSPNNNETDV